MRLPPAPPPASGSATLSGETAVAASQRMPSAESDTQDSALMHDSKADAARGLASRARELQAATLC
eukprot:5383916-Prymnesium_polylepis.1